MFKLDDVRTLAKNAKQIKVLVLGDYMLDRYVLGEVRRISPEAPVPVVDAKRSNEVLGGAGNVVANLEGLGCEVTPIGILGDDVAGETIQKRLVSIGCEVESMVTVPDRPTTNKLRVLARNQQIVRIDCEERDEIGEATRAKLEVKSIKVLEEVDGVIISDYAKGVCGEELLNELIGRAKEMGLPVFVDPKSANYSLYEKADFIVPNTLEASRVVNVQKGSDEAIASAAEELAYEYGFRGVLITRGSQGMTVWEDGIAQHIPTVAKQVYDVSGAGDCVIATFALGVMVGLEVPAAAHLANLAASVVVSKVGTSAISLEELIRAVGDRVVENKHEARICSMEELDSLVALWRHVGCRIVVTFGSADRLPMDELADLRNRHRDGDRVVLLLLNNCELSEEYCGSAQDKVEFLHERAKLLAELGLADGISVLRGQKLGTVVERIEPDVIAVDDDCTVRTERLKSVIDGKNIEVKKS